MFNKSNNRGDAYISNTGVVEVKKRMEEAPHDAASFDSFTGMLDKVKEVKTNAQELRCHS